MDWLDHVVGIGLAFQEAAKLSSKVTIPFYIPTSGMRVFQILYLVAKILYGWPLAILIGNDISSWF